MPRWILLCVAGLLAGLFAAQSRAQSPAEPTPEQLEFFETRIRPVLVAHCYECHSADSNPPKGSLRLDDSEGLQKGGDSGPAIQGKDPKSSLLLEALRYESVEMPPKGKLPAAVIADFERWVEMGSPDPRKAQRDTTPVPAPDLDPKQSQHWAYQPPVQAVPPDVFGASRVRSPIDRFVRHQLTEHGLQPGPAADRRTLIRRASFDLIGLPPTPEEVAAFLNDLADDDAAFARVVDRLLESPRYGERWGRYWLDVARYAEDQAHTFKARNYPRGYLYRDWVIRAFNADLPYDRFLLCQVAGDLLDERDPAGNITGVDAARHERLPALGLFALGPVYYQDNGEKDKALADEWDDRVDTLIRGTQALTISCARCHNHKYDPLSMTDYYGLLGVFASTQYQERPAVPDSIVQARQQADAAVQDQQLLVDRFQATSAREIRGQVVPKIPQYVIAAGQVLQRTGDKKDRGKEIKRIAGKAGLPEELLQRWVAYLSEEPGSGAVTSDRPYLDDWRTLRDAETPPSEDALKAFGAELQRSAEALLSRRTALLQHYGEDFAFLAEADRAQVPSGVIPLGNLFDDKSDVNLRNAVASDAFKAVASADSLGVDRVVQGWGKSTDIAPQVRVSFESLGSDDRAHGAVVNDGWDAAGGIRTQGARSPADLPRTEQGIGMHANALITFDLDEIRRAGLIPADRILTFRVDRAGLNDDAFGAGSVHLAAIVSRPRSSASEYDSILQAVVNGRPATMTENDGTYSVAGEFPAPLRGDGKFAAFELQLPPEARYLTLVATGAGQPGEDNSISSDHAVFSGARIEYEADQPSGAIAADDMAVEPDPIAAALCSELFSDRGLLAVPPKDVGPYLAASQSEELASLNGELNRRKQAAERIAVPMAHALSDGTAIDLPVYLAGDPRKKGPVAERAVPAVLALGERRLLQSSGSGRLELARALVSPDNPLTARVWVNRVWSGHFGAGLVRTRSNFGELGERPTHPELLDWLAVRFIESGWSTKWLHREIMLSATYRQASSRSESNEALTKAESVDPENRLLWRMNRRRLEVEPWRDSLLSVTGDLDTTPGGPPLNLADAGNRRRTVYGSVSRHRLDDLLRLFDFPDPNITSGQRTVTTVPLQQLFVLNSDFMLARAKSLAARLRRDASDDGARISRGYELLFNRQPSAEEETVGRDYLTAASTDSSGLSPWEQYCLALLGSNEFVFVD